MPSPKEVLLAAGRIDKIGRGRISGANHAWLAEQAAKGVKIDGYESTVVKNSDGSERLKNAQSKATEKVVHELAYRYRESDWTAKDADGNVRSMREVCRPCGYSLLGHFCDEPRIVSLTGNLEGVAVTVMPKVTR